MKGIPPQFTQEFSKFIGIPYEIVNCWELARLFYEIIFKIELKHYYYDAPQNRPDTQKLIYSNIGDFDKVEGEPEFGDLILIRMFGIESHIGIYLGGGKFLHTSKRTGSIIDRLAKWDKVIVGFYRHRRTS